ncbi:unnamed protein product [Rotaria magnacalcarata]|uniref:Uncharacterized protein n=1 Tax=Rotaria magnacalcarata TaxID=392030 RepID=A0A819B7N8_9BILA|nr:unnamed protein product [Rotaria magnacalcarata]CAF1337414.1 unnamed protein product [Rotaria magnacalcarata]CAF1919718.1 unnamed protein product [Rotaria magnacalcarata]CAF2157162.1 unnamed protein product [Rotaria magnacalcarata]CAF2219497.1 unnamed protein product [Rotaria magnacalcarata]
MEFLECIKLYANKPANSLANSATDKSEVVDWNERLQTVRRSIIDQLSRLKIEEVGLRDLALKNVQNKPTQSTITVLTTNSNQQNSIANSGKRFCTMPTNNFDVEAINQTELDLDS